MTQDELLQLIDQAAAEGWTELDLSGQGLTELPPEIGKLTQLETLILGKYDDEKYEYISNKLTDLPAEIGQLNNLKVFQAAGNQIATISDSLGQLANLQTLNLSSNQLSTLPEAITQLTNLQSLDLYNNQLSTLPEAITQLTNLQSLDLYNNQLSTLPEAITQLTNLQSLDLYNNQLSTLPEAITQLTNLQSLDLYNNQLSTLPDSLAALSKLKKLDLRRNPVPISPEILGSSKLHEDPGSVEDIFGYLQQLRSGEVKPLNEAKLLLVGQGSVGKTSLINRLLEDRFDPNEPQTDGINVREWGVHVNSKDVRLNVWDFGGQEIYHDPPVLSHQAQPLHPRLQLPHQRRRKPY